MAKKTCRDIELKGKRVLVRVDFNVPLNQHGQITDDVRIRAALPTLEYLLDQGAALVLMSHLGRPKGQRVDALSLRPVAARLGELLQKSVRLSPDCLGAEVDEQVQGLTPGQVLLLENLRFHAGEEANDAEFARQLAACGEVYVNDAFGAAHRAHASTEGVTHHIDAAVSGFLLEKELQYLDEAIKNPTRPFVVLLGGAKVSGKIEIIEHLMDKVEALLIGGGMAFTFYKAMGLEIGDSLLEEEGIAVAREAQKKAQAAGVDLVLPVDCVVADRFAADAKTQTVACEAIPAGWQGLDIGPQTRRLFAERINQAKTLIWNGPLGVCEMEPFATGTQAVAHAVAQATREKGMVSIIGGGDTAAAIAQAGLDRQMTHISTGGGASLELLGGRVLPGVAALTQQEG
jgi:phosphoglycerate kinase